ncbi:uncharacterized protein A1O9_13088 [Exophiala aquamarina CBS 119918]|uniref:Uncharacterized protein n=1 Tax=Exophiala aquamarina CBS 119918 TaxID=1182545 RepID=A0A072NSN3_9EURO|nr:uncharacterized protein A1O9_13088 [Exophiala aquamarina CBS 119918]KEF50859.1 hypothetical protein A1O9_13088 [Exophiala aquamarina CBS 119918]
MTHQIPRRIVLRFGVDYELEEATIIETFFTEFGLKPADDFYSHLMAPNESSRMYIILDLHCITVPTVQLRDIKYEAFKVKRNNKLYVPHPARNAPLIIISHFSQLSKEACEYARSRCQDVPWGTDRRQSEELAGVSPVQIGQSPGRLVS